MLKIHSVLFQAARVENAGRVDDANGEDVVGGDVRLRLLRGRLSGFRVFVSIRSGADLALREIGFSDGERGRDRCDDRRARQGFL